MAKKNHKKDPDDWLIKRNRNGREHIDACKKGYYKTTKKFMQVHHVLPVTNLSDGTISATMNDDEKYILIRTCLSVTEWNINAEPNCVGLPLRPAFPDRRAPKTWDGWPCHQVDHPRYTTEVNTDLKKSVWNPISKAAKNCLFDPEELKRMLGEREETWLLELQDRGGREEGTKHCWDNREKLSTTWYIPFSMADTPTKRSAPKDWEDFSGSMKQYLAKIFTAL